MQVRITIRISKDLASAIDRACRRLKQKRSEIARMALREFLEGRPKKEGRPAESVRLLLGSLKSRLPDLAERHRAYVLESLKQGK